MADPMADWSTDSNNALQISLVTQGAKAIHTFHPKMTYAIFGDDERVFGYQGLKINLKFNACDMRPSLQITYSKKFKPVGETQPTDLKELLQEFLPKTAFEKSAVFEAAISDPILADWKPPGKLWQSFEVEGVTYEVWQGSLADLAVQQVVKRMQVLVPLFIDGGNLLRFDDHALDRWTVFLLYQKKVAMDATEPTISPYIFMGYCTVYRYYLFHADHRYVFEQGQKKDIPATLEFEITSSEITLGSFPCRSRISQFIILPPFQGGGNGSLFYNSIFDFLHEDFSTQEITVEDPNEAFDDMRDLNDLIRLRKLPEYTSITINTNAKPRPKGPVPNDIVDLEKLEKIRLLAKIAPRQFYRVTEMQLLSLIPTSIRQSLIMERPSSSIPNLKTRQHEYHLWQLWVKKRLYRHNKDTLMQLDRSERLDKLEQALGSVEADYARLLRTLEQRQNGSANGKRSYPDHSNVAEAEGTGEPAAKKPKFT